MSVLLDTHVWLWWVLPGSPMAAVERAALDRLAANRALALSPMSLWEAQLLVRKGRLRLPLPFADWLALAAHEEAVRLLPVDHEVILALDRLPDSFHGDPADRMIVATARANGLPLATRDAAIRRSRLVRLWKP